MEKRKATRYDGIDLTGIRHGRLTAIRKADFGRTQWVCQCDCGKSITIIASKYMTDFSCGCLEKENKKSLGKATATHKMTNTRLYGIWCGIKSRCHNPNAPHYDRYGGRGIQVCDEWENDFKAFAEWAESNGYRHDSTGKELSIDRIDPNGNYEPSNCRWVTGLQQARNRSDTVYVKFEGKRITMSEFCDLNASTGITRVYAFRHIKKGQTGEEILYDWAHKRQRVS